MRPHGQSLSVRIALAILALYLPGTARIARADWPPFGRAVTTAIGTQQHANIATDGAGGAIVTWQDFRSPRINVFAQHLRASGDVDTRWPAGGRAMLANPLALATADGGQTSPIVVSDGAGGAIVVWLDGRSPVTEIDIFAQHVLASGALDPDWPSNGRGVCVIEGLQNDIAATPDGAGGAIVTWLDDRPGASLSDVYAQHILAMGVVDPRWPVNGIALSGAPGAQENPAIADDGAGGAIVAWHDLRTAPTFDIYAQHVEGAGVLDPAWPVDGLAVCTDPASQANPTIVSDGARGAVIAWTDGRANEDHIFAQRVLAAGQVDPAWPVNGRAISAAAERETRPLAVSDGAGGAVVTWQGFTLQLSQYAQHVTSGGIVDPAWPLRGRLLSASELTQDQSDIAPDGTGGAVIAWKENDDIIAQHVLATGALDPTYGANGRPIVNLPSGQGDPAIVATGGGGAIVAWTDTRKGVDIDIYAMQVQQAATTDVPDSTPPGVAFRRPGPNPARGATQLRFSLPREAVVRLAIFDASGRRVRLLLSGAEPAGDHSLTWDLRDESGRTVPSAIYFARLETGGRAFTEKLVTVR